MKKHPLFLAQIFCAILLIPQLGWAQSERDSATAADSGAMIVQQYYNALNIDSVCSDSMLYIESIVVYRDDTSDTTFMRRWFVAPLKVRVEIWHNGELGYGLVSDGRNSQMKYDAKTQKWIPISLGTFHGQAPAYDYRGPLYRWQYSGVELKYEGIWDYGGHPAYRVFVKSPDRYDRYYMFEKDNGLLFLIDELDTHSPEMATGAPKVDWRGYHEYTPVGKCLLPAVESYQSDGQIVITYHRYEYQPIDNTLFQQK